MLASKRNERSLLNEEDELDNHLSPLSSDEHHSLRTSSDDDELDEDRFESPEIMMNALFLLELTNPALKHALTEIEPLVLTRQLTTPRRTFEELYDIYKLKRKDNERKLSRSSAFKLEPLEPIEPRPSLFAGNRLPPLPVASAKEGFAHPTYHTHPELYQQHVRAQSTAPSHNPYDLSKWEDSGSSSSDSSGSSSKKRRGSFLESELSLLGSTASSMPSTRSRTRESEILANMGMAALAYPTPYLKAHPVSLAVPLASTVTSPSGSPAATPSSPTRKRRKVERKRATPEQVDMLEKIYASDRFPPTEVIKELADKLEMKQQKVKNWFQNKRAKERRMGVELIPPANNGSRRNSPKGSSASASSSSDEGSSKIEEADKQKNESVSA